LGEEAIVPDVMAAMGEDVTEMVRAELNEH
jgi:hypothetical protein